MAKVKQRQISEINKEVIEKANDVKISISVINEELLQDLNCIGDYTRDDVLQSYEVMFRKCSMLLKNYIVSPNLFDFEVGIKYNLSGEEIYLLFDGRLMTYDYERHCIYHKLEDVFDHLYSPKQILSNLYLLLIRHAERNKEKIEELKLALYFLKTL